MDSKLPPLLQATSGALGSAVGNAIVFPLDLATTRLQHARSTKQKLSLITLLLNLAAKKGPGKLYSGLRADTISTLLSSFLYFFFYSSLHKIALKRNGKHLNGRIIRADVQKSESHGSVNLGVLQELVIGMIAGVASKGITLPLSAVSVRQQLDPEDISTIDTLRAVRRESGILGLYSGLPPSIPLALLPSLTLYIHSILLRSIVPSRHRSHPPGIYTFAIGAMSNALATIPLYPMILVKTLSQSGEGKDRGYGTMETISRILQKEGVLGLYKGIEGQLAKGVVQQGVMMLLKQRIEEGLVKGYRAVYKT